MVASQFSRLTLIRWCFGKGFLVELFELNNLSLGPVHQPISRFEVGLQDNTLVQLQLNPRFEAMLFLREVLDLQADRPWGAY